MTAPRPITISIPVAAVSALVVALLGLGGGEVARRATADAAQPPSATEAECREALTEIRRSLDSISYDLRLLCSHTGAPCQGGGHR